MLVEFGATCNNILFSANKWYETEKSVTLRRVVKLRRENDVVLSACKLF